MKKLIKNTLEYEVLTPTGWQKFDGISIMGIKNTVIITFSDGTTIECSEKHKFININNEEIAAIDLNIDEKLIADAGIKIVNDISITSLQKSTYSLIEVENGHTYYTNGIASKNCCFINNDTTLINPLCLSRLVTIDPIYFTGTVRWFQQPAPNKTYLIALDPSLGASRDDAAIQVFQVPEMIQIAEWQHNETGIRDQVKILMQILLILEEELLNNPDQAGDPDIYWTVENNSIGEAALLVIEETGEERFPGMFISEKKRKGQTRRVRKGLNTDHKKKIAACARLKSIVESDRCVINSRPLLKQLKGFVSKEVGLGAKPGEKDDLVMAFVMVVRMLEVVVNWGTEMGDLKEYIDDEELSGSEGLPVLV